jgi:hypothetical protein
MPDLILNCAGTTRTTGTADPVISGATGKARDPRVVLTNGQEVAYYRRYKSSKAGYENGIGNWVTATSSIDRTAIEASSNSDAPVVWGASEQVIDITANIEMLTRVDYLEETNDLKVMTADERAEIVNLSGEVFKETPVKYNFNGIDMYATMPVHANYGNHEIYRQINYGTDNEDGCIIDETKVFLKEFGRTISGYHSGSIFQLSIADRSPIHDTDVVMGNGSRYATLTTAIILNANYAVTIDLIRGQATGTGSQTIFSSNSGSRNTVVINDPGHPTKPNALVITGASGTMTFDGVFAGVELGQHVELWFYLVSPYNSVYLDNVKIGTSPVSTHGQLDIDTFMINSDRATGAANASWAIQNVRVTKVGAALYTWRMNDGSGMKIPNSGTAGASYDGAWTEALWTPIPNNCRLYMMDEAVGSVLVESRNQQHATIRRFAPASWSDGLQGNAATKAIWTKPADEPIFIVLTGQSNGQGVNVAVNPLVSNPRVFDLCTAGGSPPQTTTTLDWRVADFTTVSAKPDVDTGIYTGYVGGQHGNIALACANRIQEQTGRDVYVVQVSKGSLSIDDWLSVDPIKIGAILNDRVAFALATPELTAAGITAPDAVLWIQGEADAFDTNAVYQANWQTWRESTEGLWTTALTPFYLFDLVEIYNWLTLTGTRTYNMEYTADNSPAPVSFVPSVNLDYEPTGPIHFTGNAYDEYGQRFADYILYHRQ